MPSRERTAGEHPSDYAHEACRLRNRFDIPRPELAWLLDVTPMTVSSWERHSAKITFRSRNRRAFELVEKLTRTQARTRLED